MRTVGTGTAATAQAQPYGTTDGDGASLTTPAKTAASLRADEAQTGRAGAETHQLGAAESGANPQVQWQREANGAGEKNGWTIRTETKIESGEKENGLAWA